MSSSNSNNEAFVIASGVIVQAVDPNSIKYPNGVRDEYGSFLQAPPKGQDRQVFLEKNSAPCEFILGKTQGEFELQCMEEAWSEILEDYAKHQRAVAAALAQEDHPMMNVDNNDDAVISSYYIPPVAADAYKDFIIGGDDDDDDDKAAAVANNDDEE